MIPSEMFHLDDYNISKRYDAVKQSRFDTDFRILWYIVRVQYGAVKTANGHEDYTDADMSESDPKSSNAKLDVVACDRCAATTSTTIRQFFRWFRREIASPLLCFGCIFLGVLCSTWLPASLIPLLSQTPIPAVVLSSIRLSPLAAVALAIIVYKHVGSAEWKRRGGTVGDRMLNQISNGVLWFKHLRAPPTRKTSRKP